MLNKPCNVEDFSDPALLQILRTIFPAEAQAAGWPRGQEYRKHWEIAMAVLAMHRELPEHRRNLALGVGAGTEATSFYLTNHFRIVFATDLYAGPEWMHDAPPAMLYRPEIYAGQVPFQPRRLVVQNMDARRIEHEDETFDFIYSSSSIEHFGEPHEIRRAAAEMGRVLKPGGIIAISTELCVEGRAGGLNENTLLFSPDEVHDLIIAPTGCTPVDEISFQVSPATRSRPVVFEDALQDCARQQQCGQTGWSQYPHILLRCQDRLWTSLHLTLKKLESL
jgi:SAM-dependent methyltransferase